MTTKIIPAARAELKSPQAANSNSEQLSSAALAEKIRAELEDGKADNIVLLNIGARSSLADYMVIADGTSGRHLGALTERLAQMLKEAGVAALRTEGAGSGDWVLLDAGDIIIHLFRPETRAFYQLEKIWSPEAKGDSEAHGNLTAGRS